MVKTFSLELMKLNENEFFEVVKEEVQWNLSKRTSEKGTLY